MRSYTGKYPHIDAGFDNAPEAEYGHQMSSTFEQAVIHGVIQGFKCDNETKKLIDSCVNELSFRRTITTQKMELISRTLGTELAAIQNLIDAQKLLEARYLPIVTAFNRMQVLTDHEIPGLENEIESLGEWVSSNVHRNFTKGFAEKSQMIQAKKLQLETAKSELAGLKELEKIQDLEYVESCKWCIQPIQAQIKDYQAKIDTIRKWKDCIDTILRDRAIKLESDTQKAIGFNKLFAEWVGAINSVITPENSVQVMGIDLMDPITLARCYAGHYNRIVFKMLFNPTALFGREYKRPVCWFSHEKSHICYLNNTGNFTDNGFPTDFICGCKTDKIKMFMDPDEYDITFEDVVNYFNNNSAVLVTQPIKDYNLNKNTCMFGYSFNKSLKQRTHYARLETSACCQFRFINCGCRKCFRTNSNDYSVSCCMGYVYKQYLRNTCNNVSFKNSVEVSNCEIMEYSDYLNGLFGDN